MRDFRQDVIPALPFESEALAPVPTPAEMQKRENKIPAPRPESGPAAATQPAQTTKTEKSQSEPKPSASPNTENVQNEMPPALAAELAAHRRRDPLFDPRLDASQMSRQLRKWWEKQAA